MNSIKTILVPTDFSLSADSAIHYVLKTTSLVDVSLILYHCFIPFESGFYPLTLSNKENLDTNRILTDRLNAIKDSILKKNANLSISTHVDQGPQGIRITEFCKKKKVDLIIMGTKGASGLKEKLIGSFTAEVMTKVACPVLAIPEKYKFKVPKNITYATNYGKKDKKVIQSLLELNLVFNPQINILHIDRGINFFTADEDYEKYKKTIEMQFKDFSFTFNHVVGKDVEKTLLEEILINKTDILVMNPLKRKGIWNWIFHKSVTKKIAYHINIPLLSIPIK
ncbi:universal stress protein [Flavobacterium sp. ZB4R12]|uniref:universal stress protein n=1 Tax=Flavobacterium sp. ZB4R12 TaxID=3398732 RepID=UPI003AB05674